MTTKLDLAMVSDADVTSKSVATTSAANADKILKLDSAGKIPGALIDIPDIAVEGTFTPTVKIDSTDIGIAEATATYVDAIDYNGFTINDAYRITIGLTSYTVATEGVDATGSAGTTSNIIAIGCSSGPSAGTLAETVVDAINGFFGSGGTYNHAFASANTGVNTGVPGVTATLSGSTKITLTADASGTSGNAIAVANTVGNAATDGSLSGGADASRGWFTRIGDRIFLNMTCRANRGSNTGDITIDLDTLATSNSADYNYSTFDFMAKNAVGLDNTPSMVGILGPDSKVVAIRWGPNNTVGTASLFDDADIAASTDIEFYLSGTYRA